MTPPSPPADARLLLEHAQWMRNLARTLVSDSSRAEDLAQETWTRLLERPPRADRPFRGWIATVMRNLVRAEHRGAARRAQRERLGAREEAEPSSHELFERATLQRELVQAVLELDEPYRTVILLRYFEERTPTEIAARERLPLATVKTRLARGIARLRERLERTRTPDGRASVLFALSRSLAAPAPPPLLGSTALPFALPFAMNAKLVFPLAALVAAGLAYLYYAREDDTARAGNAPVERVAAASELAPPATTTPPPELTQVPERTALESTPRPAPAPAASTPSASAVRVRGRVIDLHEAPIADVNVALLSGESGPDGALALEPGSVVARTAADGSFEITGPQRGRLIVREPRWTTLLAGMPVDARAGQECRIVVAPRVAFAGVVLDEAGAPLTGVRVTIVSPPALRASLAQVLDFSVDVGWNVVSDELGRFRFDEAPAIEGGVLRAERAGYETHGEPAPLADRSDLVLVLARPRADENVLAGTVLDPTGAPASGALVSHGLDTTRADEQGRFRFRLDDPHSLNRRAAEFMKVPDGILRALRPGFLPAELSVTKRTPAGLPDWPNPIVLQLGGETLTIEGRVVDEHGAPLEGVRVWISDTSVFGNVGEDGPDSEPQLIATEALLSGKGPGWNWTESDDDGAFELTGLTERDYTVAAMDTKTLQRVVGTEVAAGRRDVVLVLRTGELFPRLAGRIVDSHGDPVPNAVVFPMCDAYQTRFEGQVIGTHHESTEATRTDEEGRFELARVPRDLVYLRIEGSDTIPLEWGRGLAGGLAKLVRDEPEKLVIEIERRCHFQVALDVPAEADQVGVLDEAGHEMVISAFHGNSREELERHPLAEGRSAMLAVGDRAATLVLYRAGGEVRRVPIRLTPGKPTNLQL